MTSKSGDGMKIKYRFQYLFLLLQSWACTDAPQENHLRIAAASNMQEVIKPLAELYASSNKVSYEIISGSSGKLTAQIKAGAPFDVFLAADIVYAQELFKAGHISQPPLLIAEGQLILWSSLHSINLNLDSLSHYSTIAMANPEVAPFGRATKAFLQKHGVWEALQDRLVFGESVSQTNQFILSGAAEVGFTSKSVLFNTSLQDKGQWLVISPDRYPPVKHAVVSIRQTKGNVQNAERFCNFMSSSEAKSILKAFGYIVHE